VCDMIPLDMPSVCCIVLQRVAVCCSVLPCVAVCCSVLWRLIHMCDRIPLDMICSEVSYDPSR